MGERPFYGWKLVGALWAIGFINIAFPMWGVPVLNTAMAESMELSRGALGLIFSVFMLMTGLPGPLVAASVNRFGVRRTMALGSSIIAAGSLAMATFVDSPETALAVGGLLVGLGVVTGGAVAAQTGVSFWFVRRRALAISIVLTGGGAGGFVAPSFMNAAIAVGGGNWRAGWWAMAALALLTLALALIFIRDRPSDLGQEADGGAASRNQRKSRVHVTEEDWTAREVFRSPAMWLLMAAGIGMSSGFTTYLAHGVAHLTDLGHSRDAAALSLGVVSGSGLLGNLLSGYLGDKIEPRFVWAGALALFGLGIFLATDATGPADLFPYALLMGMGFGGGVVCMMTLLANYYGSKAYATVIGSMLAIQTSMGSAAAWLAGMLFDRVGSYSLAFFAIAALCAASACAVGLIPPPSKAGGRA